MGIITLSLFLGAAMASDSGASGLSWEGSARTSAEQLSAVPLDLEGSATSSSTWLTSRLIAGGAHQWEQGARLELQLEALSGWLGGDRELVGSQVAQGAFLASRSGREDLAVVLPRKLKVSWKLPRGSFSLGADSFRWGTGMLANDGLAERPFGDPQRGNIVARAGLGWAPFAAAEGASRGLQFLLAADTVIRDETADLYEGDLAFAGISGWRWQLPGFTWGGLAVLRWQRDRLDPLHPSGQRTDSLILPLDLWAHTERALGEGPWSLELEGEVAAIRGHTQRVYTEVTRADGARLAALGAVLRAGLEQESARVGLQVEAGYASGDQHPTDDSARTFRFHSDYTVGLVLFEHVLPLITAHSADRLSDPGLLGQPPAGLEHTVDQGGVAHARYLYPVLGWGLTSSLELRAGWLLAQNDGDWIDLYQTNRMGGYNATPGAQQPGSRQLGQELDLGLRGRWSLGERLELSGVAEGGIFWAGAALEGLGSGGDALSMPEPIHAGRARLQLDW